MVMLVKLVHLKKHANPKLVTELGIVMLVKSEQPKKHLSSKLVTE